MDDEFHALLLSRTSTTTNKTGGLNFTTSCSTTINISQQFNVPPLLPSSSRPTSANDECFQNQIDTVTEANDLLENGILVETNNGYFQCLSLKDALTSGIGGLNLSVEDLQNVAAQLLIAQNIPSPSEKTDEDVKDSAPVGNVPVSQLSDISLGHFMYCNDTGRLKQEEVETGDSVKVQIEIARVCDSNEGKQSSQSKKTVCNEEITSVAPFVHEASVESNSYVPPVTSSHAKKRGGWPKGRKRKPDLTDIQPPKAPATGYVLFLNEKRKEYKDLPFPEVTKLLGNEWSNLSLEEKKIYLDRADVEKKRYREELKAYRQSDAYQSYLNKKRIKKLQGNGTEESDMDATDEIEEEDNEELYCRTCDQWFSSLHNKKEHLYGRQHLQVIAGDFTREHLAEQDSGVLSSSHSVSTSLDESSLDGVPSGLTKGITRVRSDSNPGPSNMADAIIRLMQTNAVRDREIKVLESQLKEAKIRNTQLIDELSQLKGKESQLLKDLEYKNKNKQKMEEKICQLWTVPSRYFVGPPCIEEKPAPNFIFKRLS